MYIQEFFIEKSKQRASVAHNLLWYCKSEMEKENADLGRKVDLPITLAPDRLPDIAKTMYAKLKAEHLTPTQ